MAGRIEDTATIFLTNRECPFHCLMCDLWKNTTDETVPVGAIPRQIGYALERLPAARHLKLYNSGSFFDGGAIPEQDYEGIASLLQNFETVIVESHARLINDRCLRFSEMLGPQLQVAIGLETVHPKILPLLNKHATTDDFERAVGFLNANKIPSRAFILHPLPFLPEEEGIEWAKKSIDFAFESGVECCIVIPTRTGNGAMDRLLESGDFHLPQIRSLEEIQEYGIALNKGRVFVDTWDLELFSRCDSCLAPRTDRLTQMNLTQQVADRVVCSCSS